MDIDAVEKLGRTALQVAIYSFHPKVALKLIEGGAEPDVLDNKGRFPLRATREKRYKEVTEALQERRGTFLGTAKKVPLPRRPWKL